MLGSNGPMIRKLPRMYAQLNSVLEKTYPNEYRERKIEFEEGDKRNQEEPYNSNRINTNNDTFSSATSSPIINSAGNTTSVNNNNYINGTSIHEVSRNNNSILTNSELIAECREKKLPKKDEVELSIREYFREVREKVIQNPNNLIYRERYQERLEHFISYTCS